MGEKMTVNWVDFFDLKGNPFSTSPLEGEYELTNLLVRTKSIRDQVLPIAKFIGLSALSIKILLGARGSGKSTCLSYLRQLVQGNPSVLSINLTEIRLPERVVEDPTLGIGSPMIWFLIKDIIESLKVKFEEIFSENRDIIDSIIQSLGISELYPSSYPVWSTCNIALDSLLTIMSNNHITLFISIDNYDKLPQKFQKIAIDFLRGNNAQPFFEKLQRVGSTVLIALGKEFYAQLSHADFSYLGKPIEIRGLNPNEAKELLSKRIGWMLNTPELSSEEGFDEGAIHRLTMHTNGIPRVILTLAEQSMINASKRNQKIITEKIVKDTIQISEEVIEEFYDIIKKIKPPSRAKAAEKGLKVLSGYFATLPSPEFAINVVDCLMTIFSESVPSFESANEHIQSLRDAKIVNLVQTFPKEEWTIRTDILYLMGHMHDKKSLRKFLDWLIEKEVQIKPPDYQIVKSIKRATELAFKFETLIETIDNKTIKDCLLLANKRIRELDAYTLENELDSNTQIIGMTEINHEIGTAIYFFDKLLTTNSLPKHPPNRDRLLRFLKEKNPNLWFDIGFILRVGDLRRLETQSKDRIQEATEKYVSFVERSFAILSQQNHDILKRQTEPKIFSLRDYLELEPHIDQLLSDRTNHIVLEDQADPERMNIVLWKTLSDEKESIYGFASGKLTTEETATIENRFFRGNFYLFPEIENNLLNYRPTILRDFYQTKIPVIIFSNSDLARFLNDLLRLPDLNQGLIMSVLNQSQIIDHIFLNREGNQFRLMFFPLDSKKISETRPEDANLIPKMVIIDGNNVARDGKEKSGKATFQNIINAIFKLKERQIGVETFVTKSLLNDIDDRISLENAIRTKLLILPPSGRHDDDYYFLTLAFEKNAHILTNDNLRDWKKANPEIAIDLAEKRIGYFFVKGEIFFEGILSRIKPQK